ncbi:MAG: hypothetical protein LC670_06330, partial [Flavobacteriales bacterium]|nr:hypothetical protein [Flavobacteriales bacterium]
MIIGLIAYGGFHLVEYATGGSYVEYLSDNAETVALDENFSYELMADDISKNKVILVGEIHGFKVPCDVDVDFFKYLHSVHNVRHYFIEMDFVQATLLNTYMESGDEAILTEVLKRWAVIQGRNNQDYYNKYVAFHQYYQSLSAEDKFIFVGVDRIQDLGLTVEYVNKLFDQPIAVGAKINTDSLFQQLDLAAERYSHAADTLLLLHNVKRNVQSLKNEVNREEILFDNFHHLYRHHGLAQFKVYGFFGLYHIFQYRVSGADPLASKLRQSDLGLEGNILSVNFMLNESYTAMPSNALPAFMQDEGKYTRMAIGADNMLFMYIYGIKDFKRMTPEYHKSLIKMNADDSPYEDSNRLNLTIQLLPVTELFEMNDKGKPYVQYTIFVRNSDWAAPMGQ